MIETADPMNQRQAHALSALIGERAYQEERWGDTPTKGVHSTTEFLVFMRDYVEAALHKLSRVPEPGATELALHDVRKVGALAVACMEQNGTRTRAQDQELLS